MSIENKADMHPSSPQVLVVEDNPVNRQVMGFLFRSLDTPAAFATHGREAVERCTTAHYALILMDLHMEGMDGFEAARLIRRDSAFTPQPAIIALTAQSDEAEAYYLERGFDGLLVKPLKPGALQKVLNQYLPGRSVPTEPPPVEQSAAGQPAPETAAFDEQVLAEIGDALGEGFEEIAGGLINIYLSHTPTLFAQINQGLPNNDLSAIHRAAHTLKSSSANLGLMHLAKLSEQLETGLKPHLSPAPNSEELSKIKGEIANEVERMQSAFSQAQLDLSAYLKKLNNGRP